MPVSFKPHKYQMDAIKWGLTHDKCGLFLPMGAGKTVTTLTIIRDLMLIDVSKVLIIGPVRVVNATWPDEIGKWSHTRDLTYEIIDGPMAKGKQPISEDRDIYLVGKENVRDLVETLERRWPFDMIVIDELSTFKNPQSKRFKALRRVMPRSRHFIGLTGTPAPNGLTDIWSQIYLMDRGERLGNTLTSFRSRYLIPGRRNGYVVYNWKLRDGAEDEIYDRIGDICMSIRQDDCTKLPELNLIDYPVDLGGFLAKYKKFKKEMVLKLGDDESVIAANAGVLCNQLLQFTSGAVYIMPTYDVRPVHEKKLDALEDLIESANGQPVIVFYYFKFEVDVIRSRFGKDREVRVLKSHKDIIDWNAGRIDMLLLQPASAGHGLNLQEGGCVAIWYTLPNWNLELYQQANARIYRQGQKKAVTIYHLIARHTIDEDMIQAIRSKDVNQQRLIDALRITD